MNDFFKKIGFVASVILISLIMSCDSDLDLDQRNKDIRVTVFLYENCPISQYMCGPLRDTYNYFFNSSS
jgi:hypothetical protein